jgi:hypothetical protein
MKTLHFVKIFVLALALALSVVLMVLMSGHGKVAYDCRLAEISPDFPTDVKQQCRVLLEKR